MVTDFTSFHNDIGIEHAGYVNLFHVDGLLTFANGTGLVMYASSAEASGGGYQLEYGDVRIYDAILVVGHSVPTKGVASIYGPIVSHVTVDEVGAGPAGGNYDFVGCTRDGTLALRPGDFTVTYMAPTSVYRVQRPDGTAFRVIRTVPRRCIPAFYPY